jgi:hypothetical protein
MFGKAMRLVFLERQFRGTLIQQSAGAELHGDGQQQDDHKPPEQAQ